MKHSLVFALLLNLSAVFPAFGQEHWEPLRLPSGKVLLEPPAGSFISDLNAFPINSTISSDGRYLAFLNNGYGHSTSGFRKSVAVYDRVTGQLADFIDPGTGLFFNGPVDLTTPFY